MQLTACECFDTCSACVAQPMSTTPWGCFETKHSWASCIPGPTRSPETYSISLDYRPAEVRAPTEELHCYVWCQIRGQWEEIEWVLARVPGRGSDWTRTAAQAGSCRILGLSWAPTGAALKLTRNRSLWLNADPLSQAPVERRFLWHAVKPNADLWRKHRPA